MKTAILLVTGNSLTLAETLHQEMNDSEIFTLEHFPGCTYISSLSDFIEENFDEYDAFIFICAMGICVRTIAPHVKDKHTDPAVICVDSMGRNAISVLSGHIGQANKITQDVAHILGANPVISTLSDNSGLWALDTLGQEFGWEVLVGMSHAYYKNIELLDDEEESDEEEDYNEEEEEYGEDEDEEYNEDEDEDEEYDEDEDEDEEYDEDEDEEYDEDEDEEYDEDEEDEDEDDNSIILQMRDGTNYNERTKEFNVIINLFVNKYRTALLLEIRDEGTDYLERTRPQHVDVYYHRSDMDLSQYKLLIIVSPFMFFDPAIAHIQYIPRILHVGLGLALDPPEFEELFVNLVVGAPGKNICGQAIKEVATIDVKRNVEVIKKLQKLVDVRFYTAEELSQVEVPNPSTTVQKYMGTPSVCEAAAILSSHHGVLYAEKFKGLSNKSTFAIAIENGYLRQGHIEIVGAGPGNPDLISVRGRQMLEKADLILYAGSLVTLDGMDADRFDSFSDEELRLIAALVAGALNNALLIARLEAQNVLPAQVVNYPQPERQEIIGLSAPMLQLKKEIEIVAASDLNVLISGETGTGKELVAKAVHQGSPRAANPLVYLNCAALPESVAESELFGHVKGAFTGAISNRSGKFEMADNGTLFLDEIGELSLALQAKLLRVLQYGDIQRVGDDRTVTFSSSTMP